MDKFRLTYDGPDLEIIERIRRMYERVPFGKSKDDEVEGDRKKKRRKPKFLIRLKTDPEFKRKIILTAGLLWSFMILVGGGKTKISFIIFFPLYVSISEETLQYLDGAKQIMVVVKCLLYVSCVYNSFAWLLPHCKEVL